VSRFQEVPDVFIALERPDRIATDAVVLAQPHVESGQDMHDRWAVAGEMPFLGLAIRIERPHRRVAKVGDHAI
jgi:hypothetical protein